MLGIQLTHYARQVVRSIWFRPALFAFLAVLAVGLTPFVDLVVPAELVVEVEEQTVNRVLDILASSLLAVAIFSLSTMVGQLNAAAAAATPRTRGLLSEDRIAQTAISTFIGTFLFAMLGVIGIELHVYDQVGLLLIFVLSLALTAMVIVYLVLWIRQISEMGGVGEAIRRVETAASEALRKRACSPHLGGVPAVVVPDGGERIFISACGYLRSVDAAALGALTEEADVTIHLRAMPGDVVHDAHVVAVVEGELDDAQRQRLREAFVIGTERDFASDPRYGLTVLSEIASRALSPGVNDPGTAVDVALTGVRVLLRWRREAEAQEPEVCWERLHVPPLDAEDLVRAAFHPIARDGAGLLEVGLSVQDGLASLAEIEPEVLGEAATKLARTHLERARKAVGSVDDLARLEEAHGRGPWG